MAKGKYGGRRRRSYKKKRFNKVKRRTYNQYDKGYAEKIVKIATLNCSTLDGRSSVFQAHSIAWYPTDKLSTILNADFGSAPNLDSGFNENLLWTSINEMWSRYKPVGMKIKFMPAATQDSSIGSINVGTVMGQDISTGLNSAWVGNPVLSRTLDCRTYDTRKGFKRYYKLTKNWEHTNSRGNVSMDERYGIQPCTHIIFEGKSLDSGDVLGSLKVTWYYKFKNRTLS